MKIRSFLLRTLLPAALACQAPAVIVVPAYLPDASSSDSFDSGTPYKLTDNSGLSAPVTAETPLTTALAVTHVLDGGYAQSWVSNDPPPSGGDYFVEASRAPVLVFDLGEDLDLGKLLFWQYQNIGGTGGNHARTVEVRINTEAEGFAEFNGPAATIQLARAVGTNRAQDFLYLATGRYLQLTVTDNHFGHPGVGGGDRVGLGEFRAVLRNDPELVAPGAIDVSSINATGARTIEIPISNNGETQDLEISAIRVTGPDAAAFTVVSPATPHAFAAGTQDVIQLSFDPAGNAGTYDATLEIDSNDTYFLSVSVPISGLIRDPWIDTVPSLILPPVEGGAPLEFAVTIQNLGEGGNLVIHSASATGADASSFSPVSGFPLTIPPGTSADAVFAFDPAGETRLFQANLQFESNDISQPVRTVSVAATGIRPSTLAAIVSPAYLPDASSSDSFTVATPDRLTDGSGLPSLIPVPAGATLVEALGATHVLNGDYAQSWVSNAPGGNNSDYFAHAAPPVLVFDLGEDRDLGRLVFWQYQNFGSGGGNHARTVEVRINTEAEGFASFSGPAATIQLARAVGTNPAQAFPYLATGRYLQLTVTDNYFGHPGVGGGDRVGLGEFRAVLKGDPELVAPDAIHAGFTSGTGPHLIEVPIANIGNTVGLNVAEIRVTGPDAGFFTVVSPATPHILAPGSEGLIQISFDPATAPAGTYNATLEIDSDDAHFITLGVPVTVTYTTPQGFDTWSASHGIPADESYDGGDHDGIPALLEYALGFDPALAETMPVPQRDGDGTLVVWPKGELAAADPMLSYEVQISPDLLNWSPADAGDLTESDSALVLRLVDGGSGKIFARLRVVRETP